MSPTAATATAVSRERRQTVTVDGVTWEVHSRNERSATVNGRHLFACRCNPSRPWALIEFDRPMGAGAAREIGRHGHFVTRALSAGALAIPSRTHFSVERAAHPSFGRAVLHVMSPAGICEATFYGDQYKPRADELAASLNAGRRA